MKRLIVLMCCMASFAALIAQNKKTVPVKKTSTAAAKAVAAKPSMAQGKVVYTTYCLPCHQADAGGVPNMNPPLIKTAYVLGDKSKLIKVLLNGLNEEVEINGSFYSNPMPAHNFLKDEDIANVLSYIRNNFTNKASTITAAEVKKLREAGSPK